ncbi:MAG: GNAT family N-acetyltransferase [Cellvibrionaceae bacterium]
MWRALIRQADNYLLSRYPPEACYLEDVSALAKPNVTLLGAFDGETLVGTGAFKILRDGDSRYGEVKRLFVTAEARGGGLGRQLMEALEARLRAEGIHTVRLETGAQQPEAVYLYRALGYRVRGPFSDYLESEHSIFMEKHLNNK